jgi:amino acid permease
MLGPKVHRFLNIIICVINIIICVINIIIFIIINSINIKNNIICVVDIIVFIIFFLGYASRGLRILDHLSNLFIISKKSNMKFINKNLQSKISK